VVSGVGSSFALTAAGADVEFDEVVRRVGSTFKLTAGGADAEFDA
jgi:hypothetical protein